MKLSMNDRHISLHTDNQKNNSNLLSYELLFGCQRIAHKISRKNPIKCNLLLISASNIKLIRHVVFETLIIWIDEFELKKLCPTIFLLDENIDKYKSRIICTDYRIAYEIYKTYRIKITTIIPPYDSSSFAPIKISENKSILVLGSITEFILQKKLNFKFSKVLKNLKFIFLNYREMDFKKNVTFPVTDKYKFVVTLGGRHNCISIANGYCSIGAIAIGYDSCFTARHMSPYGYCGKSGCIVDQLNWLMTDDNAQKKASDWSILRARYYDIPNARKRILDVLNLEVGKYKICSSFSQELTCLKKATSINNTNLALVVLQKNGATIIPKFLQHYRNLGVQEFYVIDNLSSDNSIDILLAQDDVNTFTTGIVHWQYQNEIRRAIIDQYLKDKWVIVVDIDELIIFPYYENFKIDFLLSYLSEKGYTSMIFNMLDLVSDDFTEDISSYIKYDYSSIERIPYCSKYLSDHIFNIYSKDNTTLMLNGIRGRYIEDTSSSEFLLTKHSLFYYDKMIEPLSGAHFCNNCLIADVSGVLLHYKFYLDFKSKIPKTIENQDYSFAEKDHYAAYSRLLNDDLVYTKTANHGLSTNQLYRIGMMNISKLFFKYLENINKESDYTHIH